MSVPEVAHFFSSGVYAKQMHIARGKKVQTHRHNYDHLSILAKGRVEVECDGVTTFYVAPACITIKAGIEHSIYANQKSVFYCIHATDQTENVDEVLIEKE